MGKVIEFKPPDKFEEMARRFVSAALTPRGFNSDFEGFVLQKVLADTKPIRKWCNGFQLALPGDLSKAQEDAICTSLLNLVIEMQADYLGAVVSASYLRASIEQQVKDLGLELAPIKGT